MVRPAALTLNVNVNRVYWLGGAKKKIKANVLHLTKKVWPRDLTFQTG